MRALEHIIPYLKLLKLPRTRYIGELDDPHTTELHAKIIQQKMFLKKLYIDFYKQFKAGIDQPANKMMVELGSGGGFIKDIMPNVITSDVLELTSVDMVFSATKMPFENSTIDGFFMIDVLHHIADSRAFFAEVCRCLKTSGKIVMIEPANTLWARFIYKNFHHELFDEQAQWQLNGTGPLSNANGAIPWIIFSRDREVFEKEFPSLRIVAIHNHTPLRYLLSGGLTLHQLVPSFSYSLIKAIEYALSPLSIWLGMFQTIKLEKID